MTTKSKTPDQAPEAVILALDSGYRGSRVFVPDVKPNYRIEDLELSVVGTEEKEVKRE